MRSLITSLGLMIMSISAFAVDPGGTAPEPGSLSLVGLAAAVGIAVYLRNRRK